MAVVTVYASQEEGGGASVLLAVEAGGGGRRLRLASLASSVFTAECFMAAAARRVVTWAREGSTGLPMDCQVLARRCLV